MLKRLSVALAALFAFVQVATAAGTIQYSLSQQLDKQAKPLTGCYLYLYQAGTVSTPQDSFQDLALTIKHPWPLRCDSAGRLPQFFLADGQIKVRLTDRNGVDQNYPNGGGAIDNILVIGPSSGGGGGGSVDPTTIITTGQVIATYGTGIKAGYVRLNGSTIGSSTSGATERANADTQALFEYLWNTDANLVVSGGRGASANADWVANKQITLPDGRGRVLAALDDMGGPTAGRLTSAYFGASGTTLGATGGSESTILKMPELPASAPAFIGTASTVNVVSSANNWIFGSVATTQAGGGGTVNILSFGSSSGAIASSGTFTPQGLIANLGSSAPHRTMPPAILITNYIKL